MYDTIAQGISTLGFPIMCCIALFYRMIKSDENHKEEIAKITEALNNNTNAIIKLTEGVQLRKYSLYEPEEQGGE